MSAFIVIEGLDGAGTTTQAARLVARLAARGEEVVATHEPTDGPVGRMVRATLQRQPDAARAEALPWLFAADRCDHLARTVEPALGRGAWVVSDRYLPSSLAYQSLELPLERVRALNATFRVPDLTVFLSLDVETCLSRIAARGTDRELFEEREALTRVAEAYRRTLSALRSEGWPVAEVDGRGTMDEVAEAVASAVALGVR